MKSRPFQRRDSDGKSATTSNGSSIRKKKVKKNLQRLGGSGGLSLEAFANAKSKTDYNPSLIKKQREFYRNAKFVNKYKKSLKQQSISEDHLAAVSTPKEVDGNGHKTKAIKKKSSLQSVRQEYEKRREEEEKERMEREAQVQEKNERRAEAEARRKELKEKMFKRTRSGQPIMKYRIEHMLQDIL